MSSILKGLNESYFNRDEQDQQNAMDTRRRSDLSGERNAGLNEPDELPTTPQQSRNGVYEYNVPTGQEKIAQELGLQLHKGHWFSRVPIQKADFQFGRPQFHEIPSKNVSEAEQDYGPEYQDKVQRLGQMAKQGERKTVWDPVKRVYKTVPVNPPKEQGVAEGPDQIDELSKETMGSYIKKASKDIEGKKQSQSFGRRMAMQFSGPRGEEARQQKKIDKRHSGISTAVDKLTKEQGVAEGSSTGPTIKGNKIYYADHVVVCDPDVYSPEYMSDMASDLSPDGDAKTHKRELYFMNNDGSWTVKKLRKQGVAEGLSKRDQQDVAAIRAAIARLEAQLNHPNADRDAILQSIAHEKKRLALYGQDVAEGKDDKIAQLKKDHDTAVHWSKNETSPQKREAARQKAEKIKRHLETQYKQGVAEGSNDTIYPNAEVIKLRNGRPIGEIYQDENGWGFFHYRMDSGNDFIDSREDAIEGLRDLHQETVRSRPDYTIKGVAEGSKTPTDWMGVPTKLAKNDKKPIKRPSGYDEYIKQGAKQGFQDDPTNPLRKKVKEQGVAEAELDEAKAKRTVEDIFIKGKKVGSITTTTTKGGITFYTAQVGNSFVAGPDTREEALKHLKRLYRDSQKEQGVAEGVAETMTMDDAMKVLKHYGAGHFKTTSNELYFYKNGKPFSVDLIWNDDANRSVNLSQLNSITRQLKGQGVAESVDYKSDAEALKKQGNMIGYHKTMVRYYDALANNASHRADVKRYEALANKHHAASKGVAEEKTRLDPSCWKGYKKQGTKMKGDTRVNNCVPKESAIMKGLVDENRQGDK
jgi:hypothetical protein